MKKAAEATYNKGSKPLPTFRIGTPVSIQDENTGLWDRMGHVVAIGRHRDFLVKLPSGRILWRNRRLIRPYRPVIATDSEHQTATPAPARPARKVRFADEPQETAPRRGTRHRQPPERLLVDPSRKTYRSTRGEV